MKLYVADLGNYKYVCFGLKAFNDLQRMEKTLIESDKIDSKDFNKEKYPNEKFIYFFVDKKEQSEKYKQEIKSIFE